MSDGHRIPTNLRTLLILETIGRSDRAMTPTEINAGIGLPKQTVHRLCTTLEQEGFLLREPDGKRLRPSRRARLMGAGLLHASRFHITRHQVLQSIAAQVKETVNFVVPEETGMHYLDRVDTDWPFRIQLPVGTNVPFHCTASGKAFMASLPLGARKSFVAGLQLEQLTKHTLCNPADLLADLASSARRGYTLDSQEFMEGMNAIAVPLTDETGRFVASLACHGPAQRLTVEKAVSQKQVLLEGAIALRQALFS